MSDVSTEMLRRKAERMLALEYTLVSETARQLVDAADEIDRLRSGNESNPTNEQCWWCEEFTDCETPAEVIVDVCEGPDWDFDRNRIVHVQCVREWLDRNHSPKSRRNW